MRTTMPWHSHQENVGIDTAYSSDHALQEAYYLHAVYSSILNVFGRSSEITQEVDDIQTQLVRFDQLRDGQLTREELLILNAATLAALFKKQQLMLDAQLCEEERLILDEFAELREQEALRDWENHRTDNGEVIYHRDSELLLPYPSDGALSMLARYLQSYS